MDNPNQKNINQQSGMQMSPMPQKPAIQQSQNNTAKNKMVTQAPSITLVMQITEDIVIGILIGVVGYSLAICHAVAGTSYTAVLRYDNGVSHHTFDPRLDAVIYGSNGYPITTQFTAQ